MTRPDDSDPTELRALIERVARLVSAEAWRGPLNPTQQAALDYLSRANRFSRAPSHVADYLCATRGTVSQTLKALERKGFIKAVPSQSDKRRMSYDVTRQGHELLAQMQDLNLVLDAMTQGQQARLADGLRAMLRALMERRNGQSFGICKTCRHHRSHEDGAFCALLDLPLAPPEIEQICHEHAA